LRRGGAFKGMTFVVTGTLPTLSRGQATELIESQGGRVTSGVSKATDYLVVGGRRGEQVGQGSRPRREDDRRKTSCARWPDAGVTPLAPDRPAMNTTP
jgi:hypothetical protein